MNCVRSREGVNPCRITRGFSFSRMDGEFLASAYELVFPALYDRAMGWGAPMAEQRYSLTATPPSARMEAGA
jgi:hypothetical protein